MVFGTLFGCKRRVAKTVTSVETVTLTLRGMRGGHVYRYVSEGDAAELQRCREVYANGEDKLLPEKSVPCAEEKMVSLMNTCEVLRWDGFHGEHPKNVHDGIMFRFAATVNGGQTISAEGSANFPRGYHEFVRTLDEMLAEGQDRTLI